MEVMPMGGMIDGRMCAMHETTFCSRPNFIFVVCFSVFPLPTIAAQLYGHTPTHNITATQRTSYVDNVDNRISSDLQTLTEQLSMQMFGDLARVLTPGLVFAFCNFTVMFCYCCVYYGWFTYTVCLGKRES